MQEIDKHTEDMIEDAMREYVETISREDIEKYTKRVGGDVGYNLSNNSPQFITPKGTVIDVAKVYDSSTMKTERLTHGMYERLMAKEIVSDICKKYDIERPSYFAYMQNIIGEALDDILLENDYIRINPGTPGVDRRFYCSLPEVEGSHLNKRQFDRLLDFFEVGEERGYKGILVYIGDDLHRFAFDEDYGAREVLKDVKRYYIGRIREKLIEERKKMKFVLSEEDQLSIDVDNAVASQVQKDIEEKEHQLESAMYYHYKDSLAGYEGSDVNVSPDDTATIVTHWNVDDMSEELEYDVVKLFDQFEFRETQPHRVNDLKKTITFYVALGYGGNLNKEELKKEFLTLLAKNGTSDYTNRGFILPDGSLVGNEKFGYDGAPHYRVDDMITRKMAITNGVDEDEIIGAFGLKNNSRGLVADLCGCIRVNGWNEDYISLPPNKPTRQQLDTLEEWIDNFFETRGYNDFLYVTDFYGNNQKEYHSPEYEGKDIVDRIVRFYNTGNLYEEKQNSEETKQDFGEGKQDCKIKRKILKGRK